MSHNNSYFPSLYFFSPNPFCDAGNAPLRVASEAGSLPLFAGPCGPTLISREGRVGRLHEIS